MDPARQSEGDWMTFKNTSNSMFLDATCTVLSWCKWYQFHHDIVTYLMIWPSARKQLCKYSYSNTTEGRGWWLCRSALGGMEGEVYCSFLNPKSVLPARGSLSSKIRREGGRESGKIWLTTREERRVKTMELNELARLISLIGHCLNLTIIWNLLGTFVGNR